MKDRFIQNELWYLSLAGAFQRNKVYSKDIVDPKEHKKIAFKEKLKESVLEVAKFYNQFISDDVHIANIKAIISGNANDILDGGRLKFGTVQKLLNLYLKYMWCIGKLEHIPPHCPVDSIILDKSTSFRNAKWTKLDCEKEYMLYVEDLREVARAKGIHLAEWELEIFNRRAD